jgi:Protein of unknown function (DUF3313)
MEGGPRGNTLKDLNEHRIAVLQGTTVANADRIAGEMRSGLRDTFANTFRNAGYEIVAAPGADVLGVSLRVFDLYINAPATVTQALPSRVYTHDAGEATLPLEVRDSTTGALLGRIVDHRIAGNRGGPRSLRITTTASNQFDFESLFNVWARYCIDELKAQSPVAMNAPAQRKWQRAPAEALSAPSAFPAFHPYCGALCLAALEEGGPFP